MKILHHIDRAIRRLESALLVLFLALMASLTLLQIVLRALHIYARFSWAGFLLGRLDWTEPLVRLLVLWVAFLGASLVTGENKHIKIDMMSELLPSRWMAYREIILSAACIVVTALMTQASLGYVQMEWFFGARIFLGMPSWIGQIVMPAGFLLMLFRFSLRGLNQVLTLFGEPKP